MAGSRGGGEGEPESGKGGIIVYRGAWNETGLNRSEVRADVDEGM